MALGTGEKVGLTLGALVIGGGIAATTLIGGDAGDPVAATATSVESTTTTTEPTTTTTTTLATTTTAAPTTTVDALAVGRDFVALLAGTSQEDFDEAAATSAGPASWYAGLLAATGVGEAGEVVDRAGVVELCFGDGDCIEYSDFGVGSDGKLEYFSLDGFPVTSVVWDPESISGVFCAAPGGCDPASPTVGDGGLWVIMRHAAYLGGEDDVLTIVLDIDTGDEVFRIDARDDVLELDVTVRDGTGTEYPFDFCYIGWFDPPEVEWGGGRAGPELSPGTEATLVCDTLGFEAPAEGSIVFEFAVTWGGVSDVMRIELPPIAG
jgi:hypothetical protein